jgi:hypothetical protein
MARFKSFGRKAHMPFDIVSPIKKPAERAAEIEAGSLATARIRPMAASSSQRSAALLAACCSQVEDQLAAIRRQCIGSGAQLA